MALSTAQPPYTVVELEQGTTEWRIWRNGGVGSSDAPIVMCEASFHSPQQLMKEKRLPPMETPLTPAMARGNQLEPIARRAYEERIQQSAAPICLQSTRHPWLRASLDGMTPSRDRVVEIKCGEIAYKMASQKKQPPPHYYGQLQHILAVTGLAEIDLWCYQPNLPSILLAIPRDDAYLALLLTAEERFWELVSSQQS